MTKKQAIKTEFCQCKGVLRQEEHKDVKDSKR